MRKLSDVTATRSSTGWPTTWRDAGRYPVLAQVQPGEIRGRLPRAAPVEGEPMERILADFREIILPGVTHWNHPRFFAYFPGQQQRPVDPGRAALGRLWGSTPWSGRPALRRPSSRSWSWTGCGRCSACRTAFAA